jgi:ferritin-like metal-binding protein YciE
MNSLKELLQEQVRDLYDAKFQYQSKLISMVDHATHSQLREVLQDVLDDAKTGLELLHEVCNELDVPPQGVTCEAMRGLIRETNGTLAEHGDSATIDANLIANAQRIAHYEIAGYGTARAFAHCLGRRQAAQMLGELNSMAKGHDRALSKVATGSWFQPGINLEAAHAGA